MVTPNYKVSLYVRKVGRGLRMAWEVVLHSVCLADCSEDKWSKVPEIQTHKHSAAAATTNSQTSKVCKAIKFLPCQCESGNFSAEVREPHTLPLKYPISYTVKVNSMWCVRVQEFMYVFIYLGIVVYNCSMCIYVYVYIAVCLCVCVYVCFVCLCMGICLCLYVYVYMHACMYICMVCRYVCIFCYWCVLFNMYIKLNIYPYICMRSKWVHVSSDWYAYTLCVKLANSYTFFILKAWIILHSSSPFS